MNLLKAVLGNGLTPQDVHEKMKQHKKPLLLDVRQPEEFKAGHIDGAKLIPLNQLSQKLATLPKDREIVCICRSGSRSGIATRQLTAQGFKASNMRGGILAWQRANLPIKKGAK